MTADRFAGLLQQRWAGHILQHQLAEVFTQRSYRQMDQHQQQRYGQQRIDIRRDRMLIAKDKRDGKGHRGHGADRGIEQPLLELKVDQR